MYKKIMVAVDGGETMPRVLNETQSIASLYNANICVVYCVSDEADNQQAGNEVLDKAVAALSGLSIEAKLVEYEALYGANSIAKAVAAATADWKADLLVVGTANRRGIDRFVMGSVAEQLVSAVDASVLLIRPE